MQRIVEWIRRVGPTHASVLVTGETGTGKELVARALHQASVRLGERFVPVNCAAIPESLVESELFGHRKGAFTGASSDQEGMFEAAHRGTLFLDEIGDLPLSIQGRLLEQAQAQRLWRRKHYAAMVETMSCTRCSTLLHQLPFTHRERIADTCQNPRFHSRLHFRFQRKVPRHAHCGAPTRRLQQLHIVTRDAGRSARSTAGIGTRIRGGDEPTKRAHHDRDVQVS